MTLTQDFKSNLKTAKLELFYFSGCLYCLTVRVALWWLKIDIPRREVMFDDQNRMSLERGGGKFQVPCLRIENRNGDTKWLYESLEIIRYLRSIS